MNRPRLFLGLLFLCTHIPCGYCRGGMSSFDAIELMTSFGPIEMWQAADWLGLDTMVAATAQSEMSFDEFDSCSDPFERIDYCPIALPSLLAWKHPRHYVSVCSEEPVNFSVLYYDRYGNLPLDGYPRVLYWREETPEFVTTLALDADGAQDGYNVFCKEIPSLAPGLYRYKYVVRNTQLSADYSLETSSFVVTRRPPIPGADTSVLPEGAAVSNARVALCWNITADATTSLTYRLFAGTDPGNLSLVYEGSEPRYQMTELGYGLRYYWMVEAVNPFGVSSRSSLYSFSTIDPPAKAFNYPNPFNPASDEFTHIVFDMANAGSAEIAIFTEMGDLCWSRSFDRLPRGVNEVRYDGRDDGGRLLYNGTYVCAIKRKYIDRADNDRCRILVIK